MAFDFDALPEQQSRVALVTGANTGLGYETARYFALKGIRVILACRSEQRATDAMARIDEDVPGAALAFTELDLSSLASVRACAESVRGDYDQIDLLVNNAGIMWTPLNRSEDGFEGQMAANYFGHFLLTSLLLDLMPDTPASRVVTLSSIAHLQSPRRIRFEDIHWERRYSKSQAYAQSKLACLMFAFELQRRLAAAGKSLLSVGAHPGVSLTELVRHIMPPWQATLARHTIAPLLDNPPHKGALPTVMAALDPEVKGGDYFGPQGFREMTGKPGRARSARWARDEEAASRLWELSEELTGARFAL